MSAGRLQRCAQSIYTGAGDVLPRTLYGISAIETFTFPRRRRNALRVKTLRA